MSPRRFVQVSVAIGANETGGFKREVLAVDDQGLVWQFLPEGGAPWGVRGVWRALPLHPSGGGL